jgi:predicted O-methyltransferase YrrM
MTEFTQLEQKGYLPKESRAVCTLAAVQSAVEESTMRTPEFEARLESLMADVEEVEAEIRERGFRIREGSASREELAYLLKTAEQNGSRSVGEVGFHTGRSALAFLHAHPDIKVTSFDIGKHPFIGVTKEIIDRKFPGRHTLILGDSAEAVPRFASENPETKFDTIFIDGGHSFREAWGDITNMKALAHNRTDVIMDDLVDCLTKPWGEGPRKAWAKAIEEGVIEQQELFEDGRKVDTIGYCSTGRAWARGRYVL